MSDRNHPVVVWASCCMSIASFLAIIWALVMLMYVGDMLVLTRIDIITALLLLSGIIMLPTNMYMVYTIANADVLRPKTKVFCCSLWICIVWSIVISIVGVIMCINALYFCSATISKSILDSMKYYRNGPRYKRFIDNLQWSLNCCGMRSYQDWFSYDWHDKLRDYEWRPPRSAPADSEVSTAVADSVPLSCCKSGSCMPNYLLELGTNSISTGGCHMSLSKIVHVAIQIHLVYFVIIILVQILLLKFLCIEYACVSKAPDTIQCEYCVKNLMPVNNKFNSSSASSVSLSDAEELNPEKLHIALNVTPKSSNW